MTKFFDQRIAEMWKVNMKTSRERKPVTTSLVLTLAVLGGAGGPAARAQAPGTFTPTGNMITPRSYYSATLLPYGKVLFAGGTSGSGYLASAELYDPSIGGFIPTGDMTTARAGHSATLLPDGRVLIAGGSSGTAGSAELYDPSSGTFTATGDMVNGGYGTAVLLADGKVLIAHCVAAGHCRAL